MSHLNFDYVPLTFINDQEEIKKQIRNTLILIHLFEKYNNPVRLEKLIEGTQYGYNASALQSGKNKFLRISDIHESKVNWETVPYCNCDDEKTYLLKKDDILIARTGGTTGKSFKIDNPPAHSIYAGYLIRIRAKQEVNPDYIYLFLHSFAYWSQIVNLNERNFRPKANAENLKSLILPDCPTDIQNDAVKISNGESVKGYEELYPEIEKALSEYNKTQEVQKLLSDQLTQLVNLNQAILQEAVQGKLVKQDKKDEPASELLKRIKAEKAKSGKKEKPLPPIKSEEIPFEIPESWVWCRLSNVIDFNLGKTPPSKDTKYWSKNSEGYPWIAISDMVDNGLITTTNKKVTEQAFNDIFKGQIIKKGTLLMSFKLTIGRVSILEIDAFHNEAIINITPIILEREFLRYVLPIIVHYGNKRTAIKGNTLNREKLEKLLFPLAPISEQKRIVAEIEKQLKKIRQLKEHILGSQKATEQLLKALLREAFEGEENTE